MACYNIIFRSDTPYSFSSQWFAPNHTSDARKKKKGMSEGNGPPPPIESFIGVKKCWIATVVAGVSLNHSFLEKKIFK